MTECRLPRVLATEEQLDPLKIRKQETTPEMCDAAVPLKLALDILRHCRVAAHASQHLCLDKNRTVGPTGKSRFNLSAQTLAIPARHGVHEEFELSCR
jgi:hypothetical protein